jgi:hypothetical protein
MNPEVRKLFGAKGGGGGETEFTCGVKAASHGFVPAVAAGVVVQLIVPITTPVPGSWQSVVIVNVHGTGALPEGGGGGEVEDEVNVEDRTKDGTIEPPGGGGPAGRYRAGGRE